MSLKGMYHLSIPLLMMYLSLDDALYLKLLHKRTAFQIMPNNKTYQSKMLGSLFIKQFFNQFCSSSLNSQRERRIQANSEMPKKSLLNL